MSSQQTYSDREQCKGVLSTGADCVDVCVLCQTSKHCGNKNLESCNGPGWIQAIRKPSVLKECSLTSYDISYLMYFCNLQMSELLWLFTKGYSSSGMTVTFGFLLKIINCNSIGFSSSGCPESHTDCKPWKMSNVTIIIIELTKARMMSNILKVQQVLHDDSAWEYVMSPTML
ncbi:hypothetical protein E1301_Tti005623 [Triplophysa tibetana]|uniref:Uncharacterized protein n=1 Tax=Triplophysa tibetana TaxID=1572043 RepID=A0A5A9NHR2_9TELE|nr:hypothetical protein E1301_Tti005623 [Triplophysa tibetana]